MIVADGEDDAQSKTALSIARAFSFIKSDKSPREAFDWLIKVSRTTNSENLSLIK